MSDIQKSFSYLHENIPAWFKQVSDIGEKVARMQEELAKVPMASSVPLKRKTNSVESLRGLDVVMQDSTSLSPVQSTPAATRKRKTPSVASGKASGPSKYRSRHMIVVAYDGQIQKSLEQLVYSIGTGRNLLRKGKMAAKLDAMAALADLDDEDDEGDNSAIISKMGYRHRTGLSAMRNRAAMAQTGVTDKFSTPVETFDSADKALETAQSLFEKAAHQILREGDCRKDLQTARTHFEEAQELAKQEVARHAAQKEQQEQQEQQQEKLERAAASLPSKTQPKPSAEPVTPPEPHNILQVPNGDPHAPPKVMDIEVDDEEEDDDAEFVMPTLRFSRVR